TVAFTVDIASAAYPVPLQGKRPNGSLVYDPQTTGSFHTVGDTDSWTLALDAGQVLTVEFAPIDSGVQGQVELFDPNGVSLGLAQAPATGAAAVLQTVPVATAGTYRIESTSLAGTGRYAVRVVLNAATEEES